MRRKAIPGKSDRWKPATRDLLGNVPSLILDSFPVRQWGLAEGMSLAAGYWRGLIADGTLADHEMRASIIPVAALLSAMLEALLRGASIETRAGAFELLADESDRLLTGRPHAVIIQAGIE
jgi:hypothetical protein